MVNKDSICDFLKALRAKHSDNEKITLILDNAGPNKARKVRDKARELGIKIVYLPPYSPNLNPIERLMARTLDSQVMKAVFPKLVGKIFPMKKMGIRNAFIKELSSYQLCFELWSKK